MSVINNLYNSKKSTMVERTVTRRDGVFTVQEWTTEFVGPMVDLVREIESVCTEKGLTLSRWQTNKGSRAVTITYAVHTGTRNERSDRQENVVDWFRTEQTEGKTEKCEAYRGLSLVLKTVKAYTPES